MARRPRGLTMNAKETALLCSLAIAAGCAADTNIAGTYTPSCIAFEGNTIKLSDSRFTWDKFTDEVSIDEDGNEIDPFPGFPVRGSYVVEDDVVQRSTGRELAADTVAPHGIKTSTIGARSSGTDCGVSPPSTACAKGARVRLPSAAC